MKEWVETLAHEKLTPEAKVVLDKFETPEDAHVGYVELQKSAGKPFKLPDSFDKLPDDNTRKELTSQIGKLMGAVEKEDDLKDVNFAEGLADAKTVDNELITAYKKHAVETHKTKVEVQKDIKFWNQFSTQFKNAQAGAKAEAATKVNEALKGLYGGDEGVKQHTEMVKRLFQDHCGLTAQEYEQSAMGLVSSGMTQDAVICKALFNLAKTVVPEGQTEAAGSQSSQAKEKTAEEKFKEESPLTVKAVWG